MSGIFYQTNSPDGKFTCIVEDDAKVAYAYLLCERKIVSDLWLYNRVATPLEPEWKSGGKPPFLNAAEYVDEEAMAKPLTSAKELAIVWLENPPTGWRVELWLNGHLYGRMAPGSKPGDTIAARKDGPLANKFRNMGTD